MIRTDLGAWLAWGSSCPVLVNVVVNMSQMSAMVEGSFGAAMLPPGPGEGLTGLIVVTIGATAITLWAAVVGEYKRVEKIMTALLVVILVCFIVVAIKGLLDWRTWIALGQGLVPQMPAPVPIAGSGGTRDGFTQIMTIAGRRCRPRCSCPYGYLAANAGYKGTAAEIGRLLEDGAEPRRHLGPLLRRGHRGRRHGAARCAGAGPATWA
jgi:hypothetical protein